jgi:hypothetical protein
MRLHHLSATEVGTSFGILAGLCGAAGTTIGALCADRLARRDLRWYVWWSAIVSVLAYPFGLLFYMGTARDPTLAFFGAYYCLNAMYAACQWSLAQNLVMLRMRAVASATLISLLNTTGLGLGPLLVGVLNDAWADTYGAASIRYSLCVMATIGMSGGLLFLGCARTLRSDFVSRPAGTFN